MSDHDDDARPGDEVAANPARRKWRKQAGAGAVGLVALLGVGAYVITTQLVDRNEHTTSGRDVGAPAPIVVSTSSGPPVAASAADPARPAKSAAADAAGPSPSRSLTVEEQIKAAREAAAKDGHPLQRALTPAAGIKAATDLVERNEQYRNGALRIITARSDLTGQRPLLWAADKGTSHGPVTCTQNVRFSNQQKGSVQRNLLLCWRTSATRSVATVLVDYGGHPSAEKSVGIIDREWAKLG